MTDDWDEVIKRPFFRSPQYTNRKVRQEIGCMGTGTWISGIPETACGEWIRCIVQHGLDQLSFLHAISTAIQNATTKNGVIGEQRIKLNVVSPARLKDAKNLRGYLLRIIGMVNNVMRIDVIKC